MPRLALGLIETTGLAAAIEAADAAAKSANITLIGYELTKGGGLVTVKLEGDVGAVKAAVEAGSAAAVLVNKVWSKQVIPRPHEGLEKIINSRDTVATALPPEQEKKTEMTEALEAEAEFEYLESMQEVAPEVEPQELEAAEAEALPEPEVENDIRECCNLCLDPLCPRKKGELRSTCIHYAEYKEVL